MQILSQVKRHACNFKIGVVQEHMGAVDAKSHFNRNLMQKTDEGAPSGVSCPAERSKSFWCSVFVLQLNRSRFIEFICPRIHS